MQKTLISLRVFIIFALLFGLVYPLLITSIAQLGMPAKANGSLLFDKNSSLLGSKLIGQEFTSPKYFHSRFSSVNYDATNSGNDSLGPSNQKLLDRVTKRIDQVRKEYNLSKDTKIPADMVLISASGLDPHISLENALLQLPQVAKYRKIPEAKVKQLVIANTDHDFVGIWGQAGVNVLKLNIALDNLGS